MSTLDADALATLTPEERAAIEDSEFSTEEKAALQRIAGNDDDDEGDENAAPVEGAAAAKPAATPAPAPAAEAGEGSPAPTPAPVADMVPRYDARLPADYDAQIQSLRDKDAELRQRFKDGDIDIEERDAGLAALTQEREKLIVARTKAEISQEMQQQTAEQQWMATVNRFIATTADNGGIDYRTDEAKAADLDSFVKTLANNPANAQRSMEWFLTEAHRRVQALHGTPEPARKRSADDAIKARKPSVDAMPKTLAQVPGGEGPGDVAGEFADLDSLSGDEMEAAIARMTPAQRERYARS